MKILKKAMFFALLPLMVQNLWSMDDYTRMPPSPLRGLAAEKPAGSPGKTTPLLDKRERSSFGATDVASLGDITAEARRLSNLVIFTTNALQRGKSITTSLNKILGAHDELIRLLESAKAMKSDITNKKVIPKDIFNHLKVQEKALRKVIHLTWGALMLHDEGDIGEFRKEKKAPFLFNGQGFEQKTPRELTRYSFPDRGDTRVYVAQIREISRILNIDMNAEFNLHFDPIAKEIRKKMVKAYEEDTRTSGDGYLCMRSLLMPGRSESVGGYDESGPSKSVDRGSVESPDPISSDEMSRASNLIKFKLFMNEFIAREIDGGRARTLILRINDRLRGSPDAAHGLSTDGVVMESRVVGASIATSLEEGKDQDEDRSSPLVLAGSDPFNHRNFISIPFGSLLKPTTTAAYLASEAPLKRYWDRTESILKKARETIESDPVVSAHLNFNDLAHIDLANRATTLITHMLWCIHDYNERNRETTWSSFVTSMLGDFSVSRLGEAFYSGDVDEAERAMPRDSGVSDIAYPLGKNSTEISLNILQALQEELTRVKSSSSNRK